MTYDLHPIFVHFPIAFFLLYSILRLIPWPKKISIVEWQIPRIMLLSVGLIGAWLANITGDIAKDLNNPNHQLVEMHETFAGISIWIYGVLIIAELIVFIKPQWLELNYLKYIKTYILFLKKITKKWLFYLLSIFGALAIAITGILGGVMVYGIKADPLAAPILKLLGL